MFAFKLRDGIENYTVFDVSNALRERGWQVPAYTFPKNREDLAALRVVVRAGFSHDLADLLVTDIERQLPHLEKQPDAAAGRDDRRLQPLTALRARIGRFAAWYRAHDPGLAALRRAGRAAILMPLLFAFSDKVISNPAVAVFAAFGSFASLVLVDFGGPMGDRLRAQASFAAVGAVFVCVGTLASRSAWLAAAAMGAVGFCVLFAGAVSSVLASATVGLLLAFILPVCLKGPASSIPDRLAGWGLASGAAFLAIWLLWPAPVRDPLRGAVVAACRGLAARLRADVAYLLARDDAARAARDEAAEPSLRRGRRRSRVFFGCRTGRPGSRQPRGRSCGSSTS